MNTSFTSHLIIGLAVSFIGSVPPGAINLTAIKISLEKGYRPVLTFALAAAIVEFFYGLIAVYGAAFLMRYPNLNQAIEYITMALFLGLGLYYFFANSTQAPTNSVADGSPVKSPPFISTHFMKGLTLGIFNPLCIPFWLAYTSYLQMRQWIHLEPATSIFYVLGIATGAFAALVLFGLLGRKISDNLQLSTQVINRTIGSVLIVLAMYKWIGGWL
ncbi:MAG: LysE family transporter [Bacteroidota bacterium]